MSTLSEHTEEIGGLPVFWRSAPCGGTPPLYLHGVPSSCDDWVALGEHRGSRPWWRRWWRSKRAGDEWIEPPPHETGFLERSGGLAVDLPGFGRSGKPAYLNYTIGEYAGFIERFLDHVQVPRVSLVMHDWGAVGLAFAQSCPERIERLVMIDTVPFLPGYRWHRIARLWRTPVLGELAMGMTTRAVLRWSTGRAGGAALPGAYLDSILRSFDEGTRRAILRLYRGSPPDVLQQAGSGLPNLTMPALVIWGARDPYIPDRFARDYAASMPGAELELVEGAGHWPWLEVPAVIDRVVRFLADDRTPGD